MAVGIIIYVSVLNEEATDQMPNKETHLQFRFRYGWSFFIALLAFGSSELSALFCILGYFQRMKSGNEVLQLVPGLERRLKILKQTPTKSCEKVSPRNSLSTNEECLIEASLPRCRSDPYISNHTPVPIKHKKHCNSLNRKLKSPHYILNECPTKDDDDISPDVEYHELFHLSTTEQPCSISSRASSAM